MLARHALKYNLSSREDEAGAIRKPPGKTLRPDAETGRPAARGRPPARLSAGLEGHAVFPRLAPLAAASSTEVTPPPLAVIVLNRAAFGPRPGDIEAFNALGATDDAHLTTWVDRQLDPDSIDDSALEARLNIPAYQTLDRAAPVTD